MLYFHCHLHIYWIFNLYKHSWMIFIVWALIIYFWFDLLGLEKMNPIMVKVFDVDRVWHRFVNMGLMTGTSCGMAEVIFSAINSTFTRLDIPWVNCVSVALDNCSVNMGWHNSLKSRSILHNPDIYVSGCACHIIHNISGKGASAFAKVINYIVILRCLHPIFLYVMPPYILFLYLYSFIWSSFYCRLQVLTLIRSVLICTSGLTNQPKGKLSWKVRMDITIYSIRFFKVALTSIKKLDFDGL